ncbi:hypothetical protein XU18_0121 [Perkinsela sp. CCAP 1560/4]|nr:hypothetical protein XU18_0121 [Perkinsela sp. CCAP 1560/4]|eukprot:KNH09436.1 hypothetical protein XU18_0121 [Perkinsela sp. CCAP 1560/4]
MNWKNTELNVLNKAKEIIEKGGFARAHKLISDYLVSHRTDKCVTLKALNALCSYHLGDHEKALSCAESLLADQANDLQELLPVEVVAYICLSLGCHRSESINSIATIYRNGWEGTSSVHLGEKYASAQALLGDFSGFQRTARQLTKISKSQKHQLWAIVGNCLNEENEALRSLGMSMLRRFLHESCASEMRITQHEWEKMFSFYVVNSLRECTVDAYRQKFDQLVIESLCCSGTQSDPSMRANMGWTIGTLVDAYLRTPTVEHNTDWKTPVLLCAALLQSDTLSEERFSSSSIDSRNNFKYFRFLIGVTHLVSMNDFDTKITSIINTYLISKHSSPLNLPTNTNGKFSPVDIIKEIPCADQRNKSLLHIHIALRHITSDKWKPFIDSLVAYCQKYGNSNEWACFYDIQPLVRALIEKLCMAKAGECPALDQLLHELQNLPALRLHVILSVSTRFPQKFESLATRIEPAISAVLKNTSRSCYADYVIVQALVYRGEPLSALAVLQCSPNTSDLNELIATYLAGHLGVFDAHKGLERLSLNNIQFDTMSYVYFDSLIEGYFPSELKTVCCDSVEFYRCAGGPDALHLTEGALNHLDWNIVRDEIPVLRQKLTCSLHRAECLVWHVISQMEPMCAEEALQFLHKRSDMIQEAQCIIAAGSSQICTNEDRAVLGDCISERLTARSLSVRIADLENITSFIQLMLHSPGEEWDRTDCFGLHRLVGFSKSEPSDASDIATVADQVKSFGFPGLCLLLCSVTQNFNSKTSDLQQKLGLIRKAIEYSSTFLTNTEAMPIQSVNERLPQDSTVCTVPGFHATIDRFESVRVANLNRWRKSFERRLQELQSLAFKLV